MSETIAFTSETVLFGLAFPSDIMSVPAQVVLWLAVVGAATAHTLHGCFVLPFGCNAPTASIAGCAYMCRDKGAYFGLQTDLDGLRYCWCGASAPVVDLNKLDLLKCNSTCGVSSSETCGAPYSTTSSYTSVYGCDTCKLSPSGASKSCNGASSDLSTADEEAERCVHSDWSEWTHCSATCEGGEQNRTRTGSAFCSEESNMELRECNTGLCPVDCEEELSEGVCKPEQPCGTGSSYGVVPGKISVASNIVTAPSSTGRACEGAHTKQCNFRCPDAPAPKCTAAGDWLAWDRSCAKAVVAAGTAVIQPQTFTNPQYMAMPMSTSWNGDTLCEALLIQSASPTKTALSRAAREKALGSSDYHSAMDGQFTFVSSEMEQVCVPDGTAGSVQGDGVAAVQKYSNPSIQLTSYVTSVRCFPQCHDASATGVATALSGLFRRKFQWNPNSAAGQYALKRFGAAAATSSYVVDGQRCPPEEQSQSCSVPVCGTPSATGQACQVSPWSDWSQCAQCGDANALQSRTRTIVTAATNGGKPCEELSQQKSCALSPCAMDCEMGSWSAWSECSQTCGVGLRSRERAVARR